MKNRLFKFLNTDFIFQLTVLAAICFACVFAYDSKKNLLIIVASISALCLTVQLLRRYIVSRKVVTKLKSIARTLELAESGSDSKFPMPIVIVNKSGNIAWYNDLFFLDVLGGDDMIDAPFSSLTGDLDYKQLGLHSGAGECAYANKHYFVYAAGGNEKADRIRAYYFIDITELKETETEYINSRPVVAHIVFDSYSELMKSVKDSERAIVAGRIESLIHENSERINGAVMKTAIDHYVVFFEERYLDGMRANKFELLDKVRELGDADNPLSTISIGVGCGGGLASCDELALEALDMALGRGGDQAALRNSDGFEFFGGKSRGVEKLTKVKTRLIASEIKTLIDASDNCIVMGHKYSDYDATGSAIGVFRACVSCGKQTHIIVDKSKSLADDMIENYSHNSEYKNAFVSPEKAKDLVRKNTLLIIVDAHSAEHIESKEIYSLCEKVVVIDHHRKAVNYIDNAAVFCHEPFASSASEIVTELVQYMNNVELHKADAEALLAGIMLDTRKFSVRTGVRTFEAAAYLKKCGADSSEAQKYFVKDMTAYKYMSEVISGAKTYKGCGIAICKGKMTAQYKIISTQAIDELLTINDFSASFLIFEEDYGVSISARSMGAVNVQVIMEKLGGGGHHTMAGTQLENVTTDEAYKMLCDAIDKYISA